VSLKVYTRFLQKLDGFRRKHVLARAASAREHPKYPEREGEQHNALNAKVKVKLPCRHFLRIVAVLVGEGESYLDDFEQVHVTSHSLVVIVGGSLEGAYWTRDDTGKFCVLREKSMVAVRMRRGHGMFADVRTKAT
jgi:hypothetical protein